MSAGGYQWRPLGAEYVPVHSLLAGDLIGLDHRVWQVVSVSARPADLAGRHPWVLVVQVPGVNTPGRNEHHLPCRGSATVPVFRNPHYPICASCHEPVPCRDVMIDRTVEQARQRADRYSNPGICPSCAAPVTARHASVTFETNLVVPIGPPVTFHTRRECSRDLKAYDKQWVAAGNRSKLLDPDIAPTLTSDPSDLL